MSRPTTQPGTKSDAILKVKQVKELAATLGNLIAKNFGDDHSACIVCVELASAIIIAAHIPADNHEYAVGLFAAGLRDKLAQIRLATAAPAGQA